MSRLKQKLKEKDSIIEGLQNEIQELKKKQQNFVTTKVRRIAKIGDKYQLELIFPTISSHSLFFDITEYGFNLLNRPNVNNQIKMVLTRDKNDE